MRDRLLAVLLGMMVALIVIGGLVLRAIKRGQSQLVRETAKMNRFDFSPASTGALFRDVGEVLESLEHAKTAMRAMGKYVPIDLVRRLYREKSEPTLGADAMEISIMFTDIKDFTTMSEELDSDLLAVALGRYLDVMARIIQQETHGTIDKYIGDAIMTIWNAPAPVLDHSLMACHAALRCRDAARALSQSPEWGTLPAFETRFGLHRDTTLVGHFGAPDRMNYTAIGDGVNLASRLEGLNKEYGTSIIGSEAIVEATRQHFEFRLLDLVAVKGKSQAVRIYELLGPAGQRGDNPDVFANYERAFAAYLERDFAGAIAILDNQAGDAPSAVLAERCQRFLEEPPPPDWHGVYTVAQK
jgi:adenylate cyclase